MIGKLKGNIAEISGNVGLIETTGGVYYNVYLTPSLINGQKSANSVEIYTYLQVRDDALVLFGFETKKMYEFFKLLLAVQGVGPKTAYGVISNLDENELFQAVRKNDAEVFTKVPGLGKKTALKIILELSSKLKSDFDMNSAVVTEEDRTVIEALVSLGFASNDAKRVVSKLPKNLTLEDKIKLALKKS